MSTRSGIYLAAISFGLALAFFLSDINRVSATAYWVITHTGGGHVWGAMFMAAGLMMTLAIVWGDVADRVDVARKLVMIGGFPYLMLGTAFVIAAIKYNTANLTAPVVYLGLFMLHLELRRIVGKVPRPGPQR